MSLYIRKFHFSGNRKVLFWLGNIALLDFPIILHLSQHVQLVFVHFYVYFGGAGNVFSLRYKVSITFYHRI